MVPDTEGLAQIVRRLGSMRPQHLNWPDLKLPPINLYNAPRSNDMTGPTREQLLDPSYWADHAPEGATHAAPKIAGRGGVQWYKDVDMNHGYKYFLASKEKWVVGVGQPVLEDRLVPRPAPTFTDEKGNVYVMRADEYPTDHSTVVEGDPAYHPEPDTEALATWLEPPDGGDRRPERVLIKAYYAHADGREQVWFTTQEGEDLVHLTENVLFQPVDNKIADELARVLSTMEVRYTDGYFELFPGPVVDDLLARFDIALKQT